MELSWILSEISISMITISFENSNNTIVNVTKENQNTNDNKSLNIIDEIFRSSKLKIYSVVQFIMVLFCAISQYLTSSLLFEMCDLIVSSHN